MLKFLSFIEMYIYTEELSIQIRDLFYSTISVCNVKFVRGAHQTQSDTLNHR